MTYPSRKNTLNIQVTLHLYGSLQADKFVGAETVEHLFSCGPIVGVVLKAVVDEVLHVRPWRTAVVLYVIDGATL